jgi:DNA-binding CsgD family transcriptional regulator
MGRQLQVIPGSTAMPLHRVAGLVGAIGARDPNEFAAETLKATGEALGIAQCVVFAYEFGRRPRTLSAADQRGGRFLLGVADRYARLFYALDGNQRLLELPPGAPGKFHVHRQRDSDIAHEGYRIACYDTPRVSERISLMAAVERDVWLAVNLYRDAGRGNFDDGHNRYVDDIAPVLLQAARLHHATGRSSGGTLALMRARLRAAGPDLTQREFDALSGVLAGLDAAEIAARMGIRESSAVTYRKRGYRRLGIGGQRELFALCAG